MQDPELPSDTSPSDPTRPSGPPPGSPGSTERLRDRIEGLGIVPDFVKKALLSGVGALFMTEESLRGAAQELKLPKDALAFLLQQGERTRREIARILAGEVGRFLRSMDLASELRKVLSGVTLELKTEIRFKPMPGHATDEAGAGFNLRPEIKSEARVRNHRRRRRSDEDLPPDELDR